VIPGSSLKRRGLLADLTLADLPFAAAIHGFRDKSRVMVNPSQSGKRKMADIRS
jgi:hypothetical protein